MHMDIFFPTLWTTTQKKWWFVKHESFIMIAVYTWGEVTLSPCADMKP